MFQTRWAKSLTPPSGKTRYSGTMVLWFNIKTLLLHNPVCSTRKDLSIHLGLREMCVTCIVFIEPRIPEAPIRLRAMCCCVLQPLHVVCHRKDTVNHSVATTDLTLILIDLN